MGDNKIELQFIMVITELVLKYGIPAVTGIISMWDVDDPTIEDLEKLKEMVPPTETYFKKKPGE